MAQAAEQTAQVISNDDIQNVKAEFQKFITGFTTPDGQQKYFNDLKLIVSQSTAERTLIVDWADCISEKAGEYVSDHILVFHVIRHHYCALSPALTQAVREIAENQLREDSVNLMDKRVVPTVYLAFKGIPSLNDGLRSFSAEMMGRLVSFECTVTRSSGARPSFESATFQCQECLTIVRDVPQEFKFEYPRCCPGSWDPDTARYRKCPNRKSFKIIPDKCNFVDWQKLRVQEESNKVPEGSMPRSMDIIVTADMVERAHPGDRLTFTGCLIAVPDVGAQYSAKDLPKSVSRERNRKAQTSETAYDGVTGLASLGVRTLSHRLVFAACHVEKSVRHLEAAADAHFVKIKDGAVSSIDRSHVSTLAMDDGFNNDADGVIMSQDSYAEISRLQNKTDFVERMSSLIAPNVFGLESVKKGVLLMLVGGLQKHTAGDSIKLRGDINVCIVGDPATAKSQVLKYVKSLLSRCVYASGKSSSAAGLTASVHRDKETGDFVIEAGALMLADNGVCCIDGFDKMDPKDMVAIHEAMEQQTISIAKAGIQATLNARASILAACSPVFGRYDVSRPLNKNVNLSPPIMSRFDLFFVIVDQQDPQTDDLLAQYVVSTHLAAKPTYFKQVDETSFLPKSGASDGNLDGDMDYNGSNRAVGDSIRSREVLRDYIRLARSYTPFMNKEVRAALVTKYVALRKNDASGHKMAYRITVRQLESLIRLSEAMAKARLSNEVSLNDVSSAFELLKNSILHVSQSDVNLNEEEEEDKVISTEFDERETVADEEMSATETAARQQVERERRQKVATTITYEEYTQMTKRIAAFLEIMSAQGTEMTVDDTVMWYVENFISEAGAANEEGHYAADVITMFEEKVSRVLKRLIERDRIILIVRADEMGNFGNHIIDKHPNFVLQ